MIFWRKVKILTQDRANVFRKLNKFYGSRRNLDINKKRNTIVQKKNKHENDFEKNLNNLFDIAHFNLMNIIKIGEHMLFLSYQRQKGRIGRI